MCRIYKSGSSAWLRATLIAEGLRTVNDYKADRISGSNVIGLSYRQTSLNAERYKTDAKKRWNASLNVSFFIVSFTENLRMGLANALVHLQIQNMTTLTQACATFFTGGPHSVFGKLSRAASIFIGWNFNHFLKN